jgi:hypothetical protein
MCGLCGLFGGARHWTDAPGGERTGEAERRHRVRIANELLAPFGLRLSSWAGRYTLGGRTGRSAVVDHIGALWSTAERLASRACDPLDPALIERLERR